MPDLDAPFCLDNGQFSRRAVWGDTSRSLGSRLQRTQKHPTQATADPALPSEKGRLEKFLESQNIPNYQQDVGDISEALPGTCEWILNDSIYKDWKQGEGSRFLCVLGAAGCGKSVLTKHVLTNLQQRLRTGRDKDRGAILYYFCNNRKRQHEATASILMTLVYQLIVAERQLNLPKRGRDEDILKKSGVMDSPIGPQNVQQWPWDVWWTIFTTAISTSRLKLIYCIVDALDEIQDNSTRAFLSKRFELLSDKSISTRVRFFLTSRPQSHIEEYLEDTSSIVWINSVGSDDIKTYIREELSKLKDELLLAPQFQKDLEAFIFKRAEGQFLLVELAMKEAQKTSEPAKHLETSFPTGLDELYGRSLHSISSKCHGDERRLMQKLFNWIELTPRLLTLAELQVALALVLNSDVKALASIRLMPERTKRLLTLCSTFVETVYADHEMASSVQSQTTNVRLIHQSAKDYFVSSHPTLMGPLSYFHIHQQTGHIEIALACLTYLLLEDFADGPVKTASDSNSIFLEDSSAKLRTLLEQKLAGNDFLEYATLHWPFHVREASKAEGGRDVVELACRFLTSPNHFESWYQLSVFLRHSGTYYDPRVSGFHIAAFMGLFDVVKQLLDSDTIDINAKSAYGDTALFFAILYEDEHESLRILQLLVDHGAQVEAKRPGYYTALHYAAYSGHSSVMETLLKCAAIEPDSQDLNGNTPLSLAAGKGYKAVVTQLLDRDDVNPDTKDKAGRSPLSWAAQNGHYEIVEMLLGHQIVDLDSKNTDGLTPLSLAAWNKHEAVVSTLLKHGADPNSKDNEGDTALSWAARGGSKAVVSLLHREGADLKVQSHNGNTVLFLAIANGDHGLVQWLLEHGLDPNTSNRRGVTALRLATVGRDDKIIQLLLPECRSTLNTEDLNGFTALICGASIGFEAAVELLLKQDGIEPDIKDNSGRTALSWAAWNGHKNIVEMLLGHTKVNPNSKDKMGQTPLLFAAKNGHRDIMAMLLGHTKIDPNSKDNMGQTPLLWSVQYENKYTVEILLGHTNIDPNSKDNTGQTPLLFAAKNGHRDIMAMLLGHTKIDPNSKDYMGRTPLLWSVQYENKDIVEILLGHTKIDLNSKDNTGQTPLLCAAKNGHQDIMAMLLERAALFLDASHWSMCFTHWTLVPTPDFVDWIKGIAEDVARYPVNWWPLRKRTTLCLEGNVRISWKAGCGSELYVDVPTREVQECILMFNPNLRSNPDHSILPTYNTQSIGLSADNATQSHGQSSRSSGSHETRLQYSSETGSNSGPLRQSHSEETQDRYVHWCVDTSKPGVQLNSIPVPSSNIDENFINKLKESYAKSIGWRRFFSLTTCHSAKCIAFIRVVRNTDIVASVGERLPCPGNNICDDSTCDHEDNPVYEYSYSSPRKLYIKVLEEKLKHQFHHFRSCGCGTAEIADILRRVPKKIDGLLRDDVEVIGYGMLAVRRWSFIKWLIAVALSQVGPFIFIVSWLRAHHGDLQNAFMLSVAMFAVLGAIVVFPDTWTLGEG